MAEPITERGYRHPEALVDTDWLQANLDNPSVIIVESNEDPLLYPSGHIPGAREVDWVRDLNDPVRRDYLDKAGFEQLMGRIGATKDSHIVFYGDKSNWWACYALWVFRLFGHTNCSVLDGGRLKWEQEGREMTREVPDVNPTEYKANGRDDQTDRVFRDEVLRHQADGGQLVDVRSPAEYTGEKLHMDGYPNEGALRGGHIPGAKNIPWASAVNAHDGTFKSSQDLNNIYLSGTAFNPNQPTIAYCRIGERSSHTWFVLKFLLGFDNVRNYDGSWTEWGNLVGYPIEKGE
ncbi:sulfurtransferase [Kamptonema cortianum]|nr:sulfurtransferase [Geitlerinema splendidum]MDK3157672.1 sulfurtransferase [Kamptonema cortianum]